MLHDTPRIVFLHIPKTGGTTLNQILRRHYASNEICPERLGYIGLWPSEYVSKFNFFSAHDSFYNLQYIEPPRRIITMLREPIDRLISSYSYWRSMSAQHIEVNNVHLPRLARLYNFKQFMKCPAPKLYISISNVMTRMLTDPYVNSEGNLWRSDDEMLDAALANLSKIDLCGIFEYFSESIGLICRTLDLERPDTIATMNNTRDNHLANTEIFEQPDPVEIDDETEDLLCHLTRLDTILYEEAKTRFLAKIGSRPRRLSGFHSSVGRILHQYARTVAHAKRGEAGFVLFGPQLRLKAGRYRVTLDIGFRAESRPPDETVLFIVDVCSHRGERIHARRELSSAGLQIDEFSPLPIDFVLERTVSDLEIRVYQLGATDVFVDIAPTIETLA